MFATIDSPYRPWPTLWGLCVVSGTLGLVIFYQGVWPLLLDIEPPVPRIAAFRVTRLAPAPTFKVVRAGGGRRTAHAAGSAVKHAMRSTASVIPGTAQWRDYVERGQGLDFAIVAEQSLPVLRAYGVPLAMASQRPRGKALLYDLQTGHLSPGVVAQGVVVREVVGLPAEFDKALRQAEFELGFRPRVWALYPGDLFAVLRSLTEEALKQQGVSADSVQEARVRMSLAGGRAFTVTLVGHS
ncbi:hypothetical protein [Paludibaculum fermentans]|uniref:Uncharacterized protein n=1 Tax=Paludibaculum fermentans TaxID=1473598 RepID=A0A7S7SKC6_PALFE|nr:hypothetical protein [Paludibaculum fermentans]QOY88164.1 hypothetical protein IRI77_36420 [Paludibaculum fermentans]